MTLSPIQLKIAAAGLGLAVFLLAMNVSYFSGVKQGENNISARWEAEKVAHRDQLLELKGKIQQQEFAHRQGSMAIAEQLRKTEVEHEETRAALRAEHALRLRISAERGAAYERLAEGGSAERARLAGHATELDRSLEEGRGLVGELQATLGQREAQLKLLGDQIINDRKLLAGQ